MSQYEVLTNDFEIKKQVLYNPGIFKGEGLHNLKKPNMASMCQH
jgi:hypothetical protein